MLDPQRNSWKDTDVRGGLEPLIAVCAEHDITWLGTLHTNKVASTDARQRGMGSVGWRQVARASFLVGLDPDDDAGANGSSRCLAHDKHNLGPWTPTRRFTLDTAKLSIAGVPEEVVRAVLGDECNVTAHQMLAAEQGFESAKDLKADGALRWLARQLSDGAKAVAAIRAAAEAAGHSWRTVERAKGELGATAAKTADGWIWSIDNGGLAV
jgi:hypothetical protein